MKLNAGTSGFAFKEWKGSFYPTDLKDDGMLGYYASKFPTVEINNTFYRLPKEHVLQEWAAQVPEPFTFAIKASQRITHYARLKPEARERGRVSAQEHGVARRTARTDPLSAAAEPEEGLRSAARFLDTLPADRRYTIEFRHESWFEDDVFDVLRASATSRCASSSSRTSRRRVVATASWGYVRLHRFDYDDAMLAEWAKRIAAQPWSEAYVYFKHDEGIGSGPPAVDNFIRTVAASRA